MTIYRAARRVNAAWQWLWVNILKSLGFTTAEARRIIKAWYRR